MDAEHGIRAPYRDGRHPQGSDLQQQVILQFPLYLITFEQSECEVLGFYGLGGSSEKMAIDSM
jgi:hypothetical protein